MYVDDPGSTPNLTVGIDAVDIGEGACTTYDFHFDLSIPAACPFRLGETKATIAMNYPYGSEPEVVVDVTQTYIGECPDTNFDFKFYLPEPCTPFVWVSDGSTVTNTVEPGVEAKASVTATPSEAGPDGEPCATELQFEFDIPKGEQGDKGEDGDGGNDGEKGDPGETGEQGFQGCAIIVGTTTSSVSSLSSDAQPYANISVENSYPAGDEGCPYTDFTFDFFIPRGDQGEQGRQGFKGDQGSPNGAQGYQGCSFTVGKVDASVVELDAGAESYAVVSTSSGSLGDPDALCQETDFNFTFYLAPGEQGAQEIQEERKERRALKERWGCRM